MSPIKYVSIPNIVRHYGVSRSIIRSWFRTQATLRYLIKWELKNNPHCDVGKLNYLLLNPASECRTMSATKWTSMSGSQSVKILADASVIGGKEIMVSMDIGRKFEDYVRDKLGIDEIIPHLDDNDPMDVEGLEYHEIRSI